MREKERDRKRELKSSIHIWKMKDNRGGIRRYAGYLRGLVCLLRKYFLAHINLRGPTSLR